MLNRYEVARVLSRTREALPARIPHLALGISLDNPRLRQESLDAVLDWCAEHSERCLVFLGDSLYCYTYRILVRNDEAEAAEAASAESASVAEVVHRRPRDRFELLRLSELLPTIAFKNAHAAARRLYTEGGNFTRVVDRTARAYLCRRSRRGRLAVEETEAMDLAISYLVEEVGYYTTLAERGWYTDAYPGPETPVLAAILKGEINDAPASLGWRVFYELRPARPA